MESTKAIAALSALAQDTRLSAFRLLVQAGQQGVPAGQLARTLDVPANTLSTNLAILARAGLALSRRDGRSIIYTADYAGIRALIGFLMRDCCQGLPEICAPLMASAACAPPLEEGLSQ